MATYKAPLKEMEFVLHEIAGMPELTALPGFAEATPELVMGVLEEAAKLVEGSIAPLNRSGDEEGCRFENGNVFTPAGFKQAYELYTQAGWGGLALDPDYGGQGLPYLLSTAVGEMLISANTSFSMYPGLSEGCYEAIHTHGTDALKKLYLPRLVSGEWSGTMCLTEPHAGSDVGLGRTKAIPQPDGTYLINGSKIFISAGDHDLTKNIIHLVLARLPDAPAGIRGITLFIVPKFLPNADGSVGARNKMSCGSIEHKMGIKASSTCVLNFENAAGYLIGEKNKGIQHMFTMMNAARLYVGLQGLGLAEHATQNAVRYAKERRQGRPLTRKGESSSEAVPIIQHPDVRRMLLTMKAYTEGCRMLSYETAKRLDLARHHPDAGVREAATDYVDLMTPVCKAFFTDVGFEVSSLGVQVFGGNGYIRETGMEQNIRDAKIACIYEGTNGIQSLDLIGRKLPIGYGRLLRRFFEPVQAFIAAERNNADLEFILVPLQKTFGKLQQVTVWMAERGMADPNDAAAGACEYLRLFGLVALGYFWARAAQVSITKTSDVFYRGKLATARFYAAHLLPQVNALALSIMAGSEAVMQPGEDCF
ncbi:MAG TPA: acyl-CoA dehydrogenase C-terminal domain-containing protein [Acidiferrobacterales bacterium]|nr:acyl-CoA dehydrogenase C-terminal domain-containing protein [Acidiferrobacterales bacterium]